MLWVFLAALPSVLMSGLQSVQAWMTTTLFGSGHFEDFSPDNFTVLEPRAARVSARMERAVLMNVTGQRSSLKSGTLGSRD